MIKCPVCGKEYDSISKVRECLEEHENEQMNIDIDIDRNADEEFIYKIYDELCALTDDYNSKYGSSFEVHLEEINKDEKCDCEKNDDKCSVKCSNLEEFLKDKLNIEEEKKPNSKKLSMRDCFDLADREGEEAVYKYFNTLSPDELKDLLDDGIKTLCEDLSFLLSE